MNDTQKYQELKKDIKFKNKKKKIIFIIILSILAIVGIAEFVHLNTEVVKGEDSVHMAINSDVYLVDNNYIVFLYSYSDWKNSNYSNRLKIKQSSEDNSKYRELSSNYTSFQGDSSEIKEILKKNEDYSSRKYYIDEDVNTNTPLVMFHNISSTSHFDVDKSYIVKFQCSKVIYKPINKIPGTNSYKDSYQRVFSTTVNNIKLTPISEKDIEEKILQWSKEYNMPS